MDQFAKIYMDMKQDKREIIGDPKALYFGTVINDQSLVAGDNARTFLFVMRSGYNACPAI